MAFDYSRRAFVSKTVGVVGFLGAGGVPLLQGLAVSGGYRIVPLPGKIYSKGFLKMAAERRFESVEAAILGVRDEEEEFAVSKI